jgi:hypothetical protein
MRLRFAIILFQMMILVHTIDDKPAGINAEQITSMGSPGGTQNEKSRCLISFSNGHFINTTETCHEVGELWRIEDAKVK